MNDGAREEGPAMPGPAPPLLLLLLLLILLGNTRMTSLNVAAPFLANQRSSVSREWPSFPRRHFFLFSRTSEQTNALLANLLQSFLCGKGAKCEGGGGEGHGPSRRRRSLRRTRTPLTLQVLNVDKPTPPLTAFFMGFDQGVDSY